MICLHKRFESLVDYRHSNSILSADWFLVILRYLHLENQVSTCYNPLNWNGWSLGTLSLSPAKQAHRPWILTPTRVRGNSFPRALFSFLFCFLPAFALIWSIFELLERKIWRGSGCQNRRTKRRFWKGWSQNSRKLPRAGHKVSGPQPVEKVQQMLGYFVYMR